MIHEHADELVHNACREMEALLLEQVSDRLKAELPTMIADVISAHFRGPGGPTERGGLAQPGIIAGSCTRPSMDKSYSPRDIETRIYAAWEAAGWFAPAGDGTPYCIMIPPPNVTGTLHMGHAFQHTLMDALTRFHRMEGDRTLWQPGTDHAGIATQMVVERQLNAAGQVAPGPRP